MFGIPLGVEDVESVGICWAFYPDRRLIFVVTGCSRPGLETSGFLFKGNSGVCPIAVSQEGELPQPGVTSPRFLGVHILLYLKNTCKRVMKTTNRPGFVAAEWLGMNLYRGIIGQEGFDTEMESGCHRNGR